MKLALIILLVPTVAVADAKVKPVAGKRAAPGYLNVSEISQDGHAIHNRLTFDCGAPKAKTLECVVVQQDVQEPSPTSVEQLNKAMSEGGDVLKACKDPSWRKLPTIDEPRYLSDYRKQFEVACQAKDRLAAADAIRRFYQVQSQSCQLTTVVFRWTFLEVDRDTWTAEPDPFRTCDNVSVTRTLRRDPESPDSWNYTEVTVAKPSASAPTLCAARSGTATFSWRKAVTAHDLGCRYLAM